MLRVLNPKATIACSVLLSHLFKVVQQDIVRFVPDSMDRALKAGFVGIFYILLEFAFRDIVVHHQPGAVGRVAERLEEQRGRRAKRTVHKSLQSSEPQPLVTLTLSSNLVRLSLPLTHRSSSIDPNR